MAPNACYVIRNVPVDVQAGFAAVRHAVVMSSFVRQSTHSSSISFGWLEDSEVPVLLSADSEIYGQKELTPRCVVNFC